MPLMKCPLLHSYGEECKTSLECTKVGEASW